MEDKAQEISVVLWRWYKNLISQEKGEHDWDVLIEAGKQMVNEYKDDKLNYGFAQELFFAFANHAGRLERVQRGEEP